MELNSTLKTFLRDKRTIAVTIASCLAFFGAIVYCALPGQFVEMSPWRACSQETPVLVDSIKVAELRFHEANGAYHPVPLPVPRPVEALDSNSMEWPATSDFEPLGIRPKDGVRGTYWVELTDDDFLVHGRCDWDADGRSSHYIASRARSATLVSPLDAY